MAREVCRCCGKTVDVFHGVFVTHRVKKFIPGGLGICPGSEVPPDQVRPMQAGTFTERFKSLQDIADSHRTIGQWLKDEEAAGGDATP